MLEYVLRRQEDGKYVTAPGQEHSYTRNIAKARRFKTREQAEREACGNEYALPATQAE